MKCTQCSATITVEDEFCPYCGALNKAARKHVADMKKYNREFEATKAEVEENADRQIRTHSSLAALIVAALLNIVVILCLANSYEISEWAEKRSINRNAEKYITQLAAYEEEGDYQSLSVYFRRNSLYYAERDSKLWKFYAVCEMAGDYSEILDDFYYLEHPEVESYFSQSELLDYISRYYVDFKNQYDDMDSEYYAGQFEGEHLAAMLDMEDQIYAMFRTYGGLTDEDIEGLADMEKQEIMILLGRRMGIYE